MKPTIKKRWIDALRSGEFKQGRGALHTGDKYCCLGVLCELHRREKGYKWDDSTPPRSRYFGAADWLPENVKVWSDLSLNDPSVNIAKDDAFQDPTSLSRLNDGGVSFSQIADIIEEKL